MKNSFDFEIEFERLQTYINDSLNEFISKHSENTKIYEAFKYTIDGGGKRIRPILTLIATGTTDMEFEDNINLALAVEVLHNFTLMHDDIMDNASIRHGQPSVYKKWGRDIAILSGDMMIGYAYILLINKYNLNRSFLIDILSTALIEVCEGQELDTDFNTATSVSMDEYLNMVKLKTSSLLCCAVRLAAMADDSEPEIYEALNNYALNLGIAFQIQDDMFDFNASNIKFGKKLGQDIFENKKTFPIIKAKELATDKADIDFLNKYYENKIKITDNDVNKFIQLFNKLNIPEIAENTITSYIKKSKKYLSKLPKNYYTKMLDWFLYYVLKREY